MNACCERAAVSVLSYVASLRAKASMGDVRTLGPGEALRNSADL